jgi:hypothetical protein
MLWLDPIPEGLRARATKSFEEGDALGFLCKATNEKGLDLVWWNRVAMIKRGIFEAALLVAFCGTRTNNHGWPEVSLKTMFDLADRTRLRAAGGPLPGPGPFTLYRGVAGRGRARRVRSFSWTSDFERAAWFARRFAPLFHDPAVYRATVYEDDVLAYANERNEQEFIVLLPSSVKPVRVLSSQGTLAPIHACAAFLACASRVRLKGNVTRMSQSVVTD